MNSNHAVFIGLSGFPYGMAAVQRQKLLAKALIDAGWRVTIVCPRSIHQQGTNVKRVGHSKGIRYVYVFKPERIDAFFLRNLQKFFSPLFEFFIFIKLKKKYQLTAAIVSNKNSLSQALRYSIISKLLNFRLLINLVEIYEGRSATPFIERINNFFFNRFGLIFFDAFLPISQTIIEYFKPSGKKHHYLPVVVDVDLFKNIQPDNENKKYFLFCGSASYFHSIEFILQSFLKIKDKNCNLTLVTNGTQEQLEKIHKSVNDKNLADRVAFKKNLTEHQLYTLYKSSIGLLLPLFDTIQDRARFPHKLAEYLASGTIVLSNPVGEIMNYLNDKETVLYSASGNIQAFADNIQWVIEHESQSVEIGNAGSMVSHKFFHYKSMSIEFGKFILSI